MTTAPRAQLSAHQLLAIRVIPRHLLTEVILPIMMVRREARLRLCDLDSAPALDVVLWEEVQKLASMSIAVFGMTIHDFSQTLQLMRLHIAAPPHRFTITVCTAQRLVLREHGSGLEHTIQRKDMESSRGLDADLFVYATHLHGEGHPLPDSIETDRSTV